MIHVYILVCLWLSSTHCLHLTAPWLVPRWRPAFPRFSMSDIVRFREPTSLMLWWCLCRSPALEDLSKVYHHTSPITTFVISPFLSSFCKSEIHSSAQGLSCSRPLGSCWSFPWYPVEDKPNWKHHFTRSCIENIAWFLHQYQKEFWRNLHLVNLLKPMFWYCLKIRYMFFQYVSELAWLQPLYSLTIKHPFSSHTFSCAKNPPSSFNLAVSPSWVDR